MWYLVVTTEALQQAGSTIVADAVEVATGLGLPAERITSGVEVGLAANVLAQLSGRADPGWWDAAR